MRGETALTPVEGLTGSEVTTRLVAARVTSLSFTEALISTLGRRLPRLVIERVSPELDGGRYPVKRTVGAAIEVGADIYKDGHDQILARILYRADEESGWRAAPLTYDYAPDRWHGSFVADRVGRWQFTIEAWPAHFHSWRLDLEKRLEAGQDVRGELLEGARLLARAAERLGAGSRQVAELLASRVGDARLELEERLRLALSEDALACVPGPLDPAEATRYDWVLDVVVDAAVAARGAWYELFPRSQARVPGAHGTFRDTERRLPELAELGFDVLYLPPIHPIGTTHRKGKNNAPSAEPGDVGSPWGIGSELGGHTAVHPELGTLEDFDHLVAAAAAHGMAIALDFALQCSPDHPWVREHPEWFFVRPDGSIRYAENPPKKYEDIYPLDFWCDERDALWRACRDVLLHWVAHGVTIFRVDNPHTKPFAFWQWVIAEVQREHPETVFLAEAFTRPNRMRGLAKLGFSQSYTYFAWKNSKEELTEYLTELTRTEMVEYYRPNFFANTPDILHEYLQRGGRSAFRIRLLLAATLSPAYGIYSGYELCENVPLHEGSEEYLDSEKYQLRPRDWDAPGNIKSDIALINRIRREHPALAELANLELCETSSEQIFAYAKHTLGDRLIVAVNLDPHEAHDAMVSVPLQALGLDAERPFGVEDLLTGERYVWRGSDNYVRLDPAVRVAHLLLVSGQPAPEQSSR